MIYLIEEEMKKKKLERRKGGKEGRKKIPIVTEFTVSIFNFVLFNTHLQCLLTNYLTTYLLTFLFTYVFTYLDPGVA